MFNYIRKSSKIHVKHAFGTYNNTILNPEARWKWLDDFMERFS